MTVAQTAGGAGRLTSPFGWEQHCCLPLRAQCDFFPPEQLAPLEAELAGRGYPAADIAAIIGGNFLRAARQVWNPAAEGRQAGGAGGRLERASALDAWQ